VTIPTTDYFGSSRIYNPDIGIFEYQFSRWKNDAGSTDWNTAANWDGGIPTGSRDIVIPTGATNYPVGGFPGVTVGAGKYLILEAGAKATVGTLTNNGVLRMEDDNTQPASLIVNSYSRGGSGTEEIQLYLTGGGNESQDNYKWHYISSPVSSLSTNVFTGNTLDLAQWVESRPSISLRQGWVAFDGYVYSTGLMGGPTFNSLLTGTNGKGYNYWHSSDFLYTISGLLNTSDVTAPIAFSGNANLHGYNLLGNPFTSGLDWNYIISDLSFPANTSMGLYYTRDNVVCTYISGVGVPGDVNGIIPPMQGFFTKTYATGNSILLPLAARTHDNVHQRYKGSGSVIPLVRIGLEGSDYSDETVVRFDELAKAGLDNDFDAEKIFYTETKTYLYTKLNDINYAINGQPFPETSVTIPLVLNVTTDGNHTLSAMQLQGLDRYKVKLIDMLKNETIDLRARPLYFFSSDKGTISDRFALMIEYMTTDSELLPETGSDFSIYASGYHINIIPEGELWEGKQGSVTIIDLAGKRTGITNEVEFSRGELIQVEAPQKSGIYFVELRSGVLRHTGKIVIK
ncbi:MAG: hypothetical protein IH591_16920, partial [Bacteroidales bacterium]|nr:hypothetical protein [Bacteroidales bacterium]